MSFKQIILILLIVVVVALVVGLIIMVQNYMKANERYRAEAEERLQAIQRRKKREMEEILSVIKGTGFSGEEVEKRLDYIENSFERNGGEALEELNVKNREKFGQRRTFKWNGKFYRTDVIKFDESETPYMVISCTDDENYAKIGLMDDIDVFGFELSDAELDRHVRCALGMERY